MYGFIYITINTINDKRYIGKKTFDQAGLWRNYLGSGKLLKEDIEKYGEDVFKREIIYIASNLNSLNEAERFYIEKFDAVNSDVFYNLNKGGDGGFTKKNCGYENGMFGKKHTDRTKRKNGTKTRKRFEDPDFRKRHSEGVAKAMSKLPKGTLAFNKRKRNKKIVCDICGNEEMVYTSQQKYCSECKSKYARWELKNLARNK